MNQGQLAGLFGQSPEPAPPKLPSQSWLPKLSYAHFGIFGNSGKFTAQVCWIHTSENPRPFFNHGMSLGTEQLKIPLELIIEFSYFTDSAGRFKVSLRIKK